MLSLCVSDFAIGLIACHCFEKGCLETVEGSSREEEQRQRLAVMGASGYRRLMERCTASLKKPKRKEGQEKAQKEVW